MKITSKEHKKYACVYKFTSKTEPSMFYIGSTKNLYERYCHHKSHLNNNRHQNINTVRLFELYGFDDFIWEIVVDCNWVTEDERYDLEQWHIDIDKPTINLHTDSRGARNYPHTKETKEHLRKINTGKKMSPESVLKWKEKMVGRPQHPKTKEIFQKYVDSLKRKIDQFDQDMNFIKTWDSISEAGHTLNLKIPHISRVLAGGRKKTGGFIFKYSNN